MTLFSDIQRAVGVVEVFCENTYYASGLALQVPSHMVAVNFNADIVQVHDVAFVVVATFGLAKWAFPHVAKLGPKVARVARKIAAYLRHLLGL